MTDRALLELAASHVSYDPETGSMKWNARNGDGRDIKRWNSRYAGKEVGTYDNKGYRRILMRFGNETIFRVRVHQLAWFIVHGQQVGEIDHINQIKADNRIANLRDVPKTLNQRNGTRKRNNTSGYPGVTWHKQREKWCAQAFFDGRHHHIGLYSDIEEAAAAAREYRARHGFTENHGRSIGAAAEIGKTL